MGAFHVQGKHLLHLGDAEPDQPAELSAPRLVDRCGHHEFGLLGSVLGMLNGYFIVGSLWYYLHTAQYPWPDLISSPPPDVITNLVQFLPPKVIGSPPYIFFAIGAAFVFVIIVFL